MRHLAILGILSFGLCSAQKASAASFGCESVGGSVIFKDTLYGVLTGTLLSGLAILASDSGSASGDIVTGGAAVGGLLGLGLGIAEVSLRECPPHGFGQTEGFHSSLALMPSPSGSIEPGVRLSWNF